MAHGEENDGRICLDPRITCLGYMPVGCVFPPHLHERIGVGFLSCLHWLLGFVNRDEAEKRGTRKEHIK